MPSRGSLPSTGRPYTLLTLLTGQRAPPLAKREGAFRFAFRGAKTARPTQARCPPTSLLVRGMRAPICIFVCVGTKLPQRKLVVNSVIPSRLGGPCPPTPPGVVRGVGSRKARGKFLAGPPRGASEMQQLVNENCSDWYKETEMICHAGDPYAGPQAALAKRKEHSRLRRAALSATASARWFFCRLGNPGNQTRGHFGWLEAEGYIQEEKGCRTQPVKKHIKHPTTLQRQNSTNFFDGSKH
jgi:hypothetical protein